MIGTYVMEALACYDRWHASDADPDEYDAFAKAMENLRRAIARTINDHEAAR